MSPVVRTCIGCRERTDKTALVRITGKWQETHWVIRPDIDDPQPGRGAHLHPESRCFELARRRGAIRRALKLEGELELSALSELFDKKPQQTH